jgi:hypothetical protein
VPIIRVAFCRVLHSGRPLTLPTNIRLEWNTPAYYDTATSTAVQSFIVQGPVI